MVFLLPTVIDSLIDNRTFKVVLNIYQNHSDGCHKELFGYGLIPMLFQSYGETTALHLTFWFHEFLYFMRKYDGKVKSKANSVVEI